MPTAGASSGELEASGIRPEVAAEFTSSEAVKRCAEAGMGVAVLARVSVRSELEAGYARGPEVGGSRAASKNLPGVASGEVALSGARSHHGHCKESARTVAAALTGRYHNTAG